MELLIGVGNALVVAIAGLVLGWMGKTRFESLERRIDPLEGRLESTRSDLQSSIDGLRSDVTNIALVVGARPGASNA